MRLPGITEIGGCPYPTLKTNVVMRNGFFGCEAGPFYLVMAQPRY